MAIKSQVFVILNVWLEIFKLFQASETNKSLVQVDNGSPSTDLYDFDHSEDNSVSLSSSTAVKKSKNKQSQPNRSLKLQKSNTATKKVLTPKTDVNIGGKKLKTANSNKISDKKMKSKDAKTAKQSKRTPGSQQKSENKKLVDMIAWKASKKSSVASDSGVFMTPSPIQGKQVFHGSFKSKPSSTPSGIPNEKKAEDEQLEAPLIAPPDLSPVKCFTSPNTGTIHGGIVTSPELSQSTPPSTMTQEQTEPSQENGEEDIALPFNELQFNDSK